MATMNLADPELELIDPTPNVHMLFIQFDKVFFWTKLASRAVVRWSKRMYSCAGICSYEGGGGLCDIALSEPLLRLRPRKDLVETLLHEMIHAFLFVTNRDQDRDGHGPNFKAHMHRINQSAGLNISIYHDFHDEVRLYQQHWWRCNGPCQKMRPHFGIVRRTRNQAPGPTDYWWTAHQRKCGGSFVKIKEPEKKPPTKKTTKANTKKTITSKPTADITKYINNSVTNTKGSIKPILKDSNMVTTNTNTSNSIVGLKDIMKSPQTPIPVFTGNGYTINNNKHVTDLRNVTEHVRNIWANKQIPSIPNKASTKNLKTSNVFKKPSSVVGASNPKKHKADIPSSPDTPPAKIKKIDIYFKANATLVLKDLYGDDIKLTQSKSGNKLVAVSVTQELVDCPVCKAKVDSKEINRHLDECLNKEVIEKLSQDNSVQVVESTQSITDRNRLKALVGDMPPIPAFKGAQENTRVNNNDKNLPNSNNSFLDNVVTNRSNVTESDTNLRNIQKPTIKILRKSDSFITKDRGDDINKIKDRRNSVAPTIKQEPDVIEVKAEPGSSKDGEGGVQKCPCCGEAVNNTMEEHLDECLVLFDTSQSLPEEGASTSYCDNTTIVIDDDDDVFDESQVLNATSTKTPCPSCMEMVEQAEMNDHLDVCLGLS